MRNQNYSNHIRYYIPHHFIFYPVLCILLGAAFLFARKFPEQQLLWTFISINLFMIAALSFMLRQHYALGNQNRIVRLEMRFRYYVLTGARFELLEKSLTFAQIAALRFASDDELPGMVDKAISEKLTSDEIKKGIQQWNPDFMRL